MERISRKDRDILRAVASRQMELAAAPGMRDLAGRWVRHNACKPGMPMVVIEWQTFADEVVLPRLRCEGETARRAEWRLYANFIGQEEFHDDSFVPDFMPVQHDIWFKPFDIDVVAEHIPGTNSLGHHFRETVTDLEADFGLLRPSPFGVNREKTNETLSLYQDLFGDILPSRLVGSTLVSVPTQSIVHIMSMETMLFALCDCPEKFHRMMRMLTDDTLRFFRFLEAERLLMPTVAGEPVGNGTFAFTDELPAQGPMTTRDVWGFMDSQETTAISPAMFEAFIFPYYEEIAAQYGLLSYGCCEAVHPVWANCLSKLPNLRKLSISPWCDEAYMGEQLRGRKIIYHRKPSPNFLGADATFSASAFKEHIEATLRAARGCTVEFTQRDVYTVHHDLEKVREYVRIVRRCCEKHVG